MKLRNPFTTDQLELFRDHYFCALCGRSDKGLEAHHIVGRSSNATTNLAVLCTECHAHMGHTKEEEQELYELTRAYLKNQDYSPDNKDEKLQKVHPHLTCSFDW